MEFGEELRCGLGAEVRSLPWVDCWGLRSEGTLLPTPFLHEGEPVRSGFQAQETTSKGAGPREPEATQTLFALWRLVG